MRLPALEAVGLLVGADAFGQTPVEHHDLAEVSQHHVLPLEIAVDDAPRMGIGHGVANVDKRRQELDSSDRVGLAGGPLLVIGPDGLAQGAAPHEPHRVVGRFPFAQLVDRHDSRVLELSRDLGLVKKARTDDRVIGLVGRSSLSAIWRPSAAIAGQPDPPHSSLGMQMGQRIALAALLARRQCRPARRGRLGAAVLRG